MEIKIEKEEAVVILRTYLEKSLSDKEVVPDGDSYGTFTFKVAEKGAVEKEPEEHTDGLD